MNRNAPLIVIVCIASICLAEAPKSPEALPDPTASISALQRAEFRIEQRLESVEDRLEVIRRTVSDDKLTTEEQRNMLLRESQGLNEARQMEQIRLNETLGQLRKLQTEQLRAIFGDQCYITMQDQKEEIGPARLVGVLDLAGRRVVQFELKDQAKVTLDPSRIAAARITMPDPKKPE